MKIYEELKAVCCYAPASVATATEVASSYVSAEGCSRIAFVVTAASLASGKTLELDIYHADDSTGTSAAKLSDGSFTLAAQEAPGTYVAEVIDLTGKKPYFAVKFKHDAGAAVICAAIALTDPTYKAAVNTHVTTA